MSKYIEERVFDLEKDNTQLKKLCNEILCRLNDDTKQDNQPVYITIPKAAKLLGKHRNTISNYIKDGRLNQFKGKGKFKIRVSLKEVELLKKTGI